MSRGPARPLLAAKDIPAVILIARMGIQHGLTAAVIETDPVRNAALRSAAKALAYDLASFTWPGWDEPGVALGPNDLRIGLDAARTNLRLAIELEKGLLPLSRAHWLLGAHLLSALDTASSLPHFEEAASAAAAADSPAEALLARGFAALASGPEAGLQDVLTRLRALPDGDSFAAQIETARRVLRL